MLKGVPTETRLLLAEVVAYSCAAPDGSTSVTVVLVVELLLIKILLPL